MSAPESFDRERNFGMDHGEEEAAWDRGVGTEGSLSAQRELREETRKGETEQVGLVLDPKESNLNWIPSNGLGLFTLDQGVLGLENEGKKFVIKERRNENNGPGDIWSY